MNQKLFNTSSKKKRTGGRERPNLATQPSGPTNSPLCTTARLKPPLPTSAYKGNKWHKMFRTPEFYSARKKLAALCNPLYLGMKHLYKKRPPLWYGHFGAVFSCPGRIFSYCGRARAYTHVLARVYSTRASTCTIYMCFTLPHTRVNLTGLQLWGFQRARSFVTEIRTSMLSNKCFTGAYVLNWSHFCCIIIFWGCPTIPILHFLTISNGEGAGSKKCKKKCKIGIKLTQKESWSLDFFRFSSWTPQNELWN